MKNITNKNARIHITPNTCRFCIAWQEITHASFIEYYGRYGNCIKKGVIKSANETCGEFERC